MFARIIVLITLIQLVPYIYICKSSHYQAIFSWTDYLTFLNWVLWCFCLFIFSAGDYTARASTMLGKNSNTELYLQPFFAPAYRALSPGALHHSAVSPEPLYFEIDRVSQCCPGGAYNCDSPASVFQAAGIIDTCHWLIYKSERKVQVVLLSSESCEGQVTELTHPVVDIFPSLNSHKLTAIFRAPTLC